MLYRHLVAGLAGVLSLTSVASAQEASQIWNYWGSGSEHAAIQAVIDLSNATYPDTPVENHVFPGNTVELRRQLQTALLGGTAPAAYQSAMGYELKTFVDADQLRPVTDVWNEVQGDKIFPTGLQRVMKVGGVPYAIPLNMAITSNIFYNKAIFDKLGLSAPKTFEELQALCDKVEATGIGCLANGAGPFWSLYSFYPPLISVIGVDGYFKLAAGELPFDGPEFRKALRLYGDTYAKHYIKNWSGKTWAQGADDVVAGRAALYEMGDWVSSYFKDVKWVPGKDYDFFPAPSIGPAVVIQVDAIASPNGTATATAAADNFMRVAASPKGQADFNVHKGSIAANLNTPTDIYDYVGKKTYEEMQTANAANAVLPNLFFLLPTDLGSELGVQLERFAADPSDATLDSVVTKLEALRTEAKAQNAFVTW
jgi:glucose/mannose transport system substrate-binding protein